MQRIFFSCLFDFNVKIVPSLTALLFYITYEIVPEVYSFTSIGMSSIVISSPW